MLALSVCAGCGDNEGDDDLVGDAGGGETNDTEVGATEANAFAVATDFVSGMGVASTIALPELELTTNVLAGVVSNDPTLAYQDRTIYIVNRFGSDNIVILNVVSGRELQFEGQISTGAGSNPQGVVAVGSKLYVPALGTAGVVVIDTNSPDELGLIDLSELDENDGLPECNTAYLDGTTLYVACGVLDAFTPVGPGKIAVIDTTTDTLIEAFDMATPNPFGGLVATPDGDLLLGTVDFGAGLTSGCIERITLGESPSSAGCLIENKQLGGYAGSYKMGSDGSLYLTVTTGFTEDDPAPVLRYDLTEGVLDTTPLNNAGQQISSLTQCPTGEWIVTDRSGASGLRVYSAEWQELTSEQLNIVMPPAGTICY
ncbi:MAG: hypothetical protein AAGC55_07200 [Myxococcota bacterium]